MKKSTRIFISTITIIAISLFMAINVCATSDYPRELSDSFVKAEILKAIEIETDQSSWDSSTTWYEVIPLYDCYDICNGYIYKLQTHSKKTGYIQINRIDGTESLACYSFDGEPAYEAMLRSTNKPEVYETNGRLYFFGNITYCVKDSNGNYILLSNFNQYDQHIVQKQYEEFIEGFKSRKAEEERCDASNDDNSHPLPVPSRSFSWSTTSDFSNIYVSRPNGIMEQVMEHCSPTAGTNIMRYFRWTGSSSLSNDIANSTIFVEMYYAMDTNGISSSNTITHIGTYWSDINPGITTFCTSRNCFPTSIGTISGSSITYNGIKDHINSNELLQAELEDFPSSGSNHSVVVVGYNLFNLSIANGWTSSLTTYSYLFLDFGQLVYVGY